MTEPKPLPSETKLVERLKDRAEDFYDSETRPDDTHKLLVEAAAALASLADELRQAQERCAELEKALVEYRKPPRMIVQCERHKGTPIIFKAYAQTTYASYCPQCENDAAASGPKEG